MTTSVAGGEEAAAAPRQASAAWNRERMGSAIREPCGLRRAGERERHEQEHRERDRIESSHPHRSI
jgi:hypothetical protein